jgi:hypothetical protein
MIITPANFGQSGNDYFTWEKLSANADIAQTYYHTAIIRLGDMADFFDKLNLARAYVRLIVNVNVGSVKIAGLTNGKLVTGASTVVSNFSFNTCPFMLSNFDTNNTLGATTAINAQIGIVKLQSINTNATISHQLSAARVYAPSILLNPEKEKLYRMNNAQKLIVWKDIFSTNLLNIEKGSSANYVISNGISNLVGLLTIPIISSESNQGLSGYGQYAPNLLPFGSEPSTTSPY